MKSPKMIRPGSPRHLCRRPLRLRPFAALAAFAAGLLVTTAPAQTAPPDAAGPDAATSAPATVSRRLAHDEADGPAPVDSNTLLAHLRGLPAPLVESLHLHLRASYPADPGWTNALASLAVAGDELTLHLLAELKTARVAPEKLKLINDTARMLETRLKNGSPQPPPERLINQLERAAVADVTCHSLETTVVPWTLKFARAQATRAEVRAALERLSAPSKAATATNGPADFGALTHNRAASYARRLLDEQAVAGPAPKAP